MAELDAAFTEMIATLVEARDMLQNELAAFSSGQTPDGLTLGRLHQSALSFKSQADALLRMMRDRGADGGLTTLAEELANFFYDAVDRIESFGEAARG